MIARAITTPRPHFPGERREAAGILRGAGHLILERGVEPTPANAWSWTPEPGCAVDIANAMSLTRFGVYATGGWAGKYWRCQDRPYGIAHDRLLRYLWAEHGCDVCSFNSAAERGRDVAAALLGVAEDVHRGPDPLVPGRASTRDRVAAWRGWLDERLAAGDIAPPGYVPESVVEVPVEVPAAPVLDPRFDLAVILREERAAEARYRRRYDPSAVTR